LPRFFFHFHDGTSKSRDDHGIEFGSAEEAYLGAFGAARDMWPELIDAWQDPMACSFEIADAQETVLFQLPFAETLESCQMAPKKPVSSAEIQRGIDEVHRRVLTARAELRSGFDSARSSLVEAKRLLARLDVLTSTRHRKVIEQI
jgi:hypothetical protein